MGILSKIGFNLNPVGTVMDIINKWKPGKCKTEKDYEKSLYNFLEKQLPDIEIVKQFGIGRTKVDIAVARKVFIEIKYNLNSTSKLQRLIGQLSLYKKEKDEDLIILLCGDFDKNMMMQLEREVEEQNRKLLLWEPNSVFIMHKK